MLLFCVVFFLPALTQRPFCYQFRYDAVFLYANETQYQQFRLPRNQVPSPNGEQVWIRRGRLNRASSRDAMLDNATASTLSTASTTSNTTTSTTSQEDEMVPSVLSDEVEWHNVYECIDPIEWNLYKNGEPGRTVQPVLYTGSATYLSVKISTAELTTLKDEYGDIRFHKVLEWTLPTFGEDDQILFNWQATRMRNYMLQIMDTQLYKPKYYNPPEGNIISGSDVARFYGVFLGRSLSGGGAITDLWSTRDYLSAYGPIK